MPTNPDGRSASAPVSRDPIREASITLKDGRTVHLFVNRDTNLVVLDIVDADDQGGIEVYRSIRKPTKPISQTKAGKAAAETWELDDTADERDNSLDTVRLNARTADAETYLGPDAAAYLADKEAQDASMHPLDWAEAQRDWQNP